MGADTKQLPTTHYPLPTHHYPPPFTRYTIPVMPSSPPFTVLFLGTSTFAVPSLRALAEHPAFEVLQVITQPDRPVGRRQVVTPPPVKVAAEALRLPLLQSADINVSIASPMSHVPSPDYLVVVSYGQILSDKVLALPLVAPVNVHASLLPKLRGASPIQHALLLGMPETGVTVQRMVAALDAGPILSQRTIGIAPTETYTSLHDKLATMGASLLTATLTGKLQPQNQDESEATFCRKLTRDDGVADPKIMDAATIDRMVRALNPWPGVRIGKHKILRTSLADTPDALRIPCRDTSTLYVLSIQPPSKNPMTGAAFSRGYSLDA